MSSPQIELDFNRPAPEPAPTEVAPRPALTVGELTRHLMTLVRQDPILQDIWVRGELSRYTRHASGHHYFTLKDEQAVLSCVMWRTAAASVRFSPAEGLQVIAHGRIDVYDRRGQYQLVVDEMQPDGLGALFLAFEQTRKRLEAEGLFAGERKRPLPVLPRRVAIVTSRTGAALRDMLHILRRDPPAPEIVLVPALVQGESAAESVCAAIELANRASGAELLIVGRGGGSLEDLWTFNEERVARAIVASALPVISAVGHESDTTLADYAADVRAPTPTAAAEMVAALRAAWLERLDEQVLAAGRALERRLREARHAYDAVARHPALRRLLDPVETRRQWIDDLDARRLRARDAVLRNRRQRLEVLVARLEGLSPLAVLRRGFAAVSRLDDGRRLESATEVSRQDHLRIDWADGFAESTVTRVERTSPGGA